jgi:hypothetical protein
MPNAPDNLPNPQGHGHCTDPNDPACHDMILRALQQVKDLVATAVSNINPQHHRSDLIETLRSVKSAVDNAHDRRTMRSSCEANPGLHPI